MSDAWDTAWGPSGPHQGAGQRRNPAWTLDANAAEGATVLLLGLEDLQGECWAVLVDAGILIERAADVTGALRTLTARPVPVVIASARWAQALMNAIRAQPELPAIHVVVAAALDSPNELRTALDAGADDVMRVPFEPEVLSARVGAGLRAARLRANEALMRSLVTNIPGALYRCACDADWTMEWLSDEVERLTGARCATARSRSAHAPVGRHREC